MTSKQYKERHKDYLTVGQLKKQLADYPNDALVVAQRIEDVYYDTLNGWETLKKPHNIYPEFNSEYTAVWSPVSYGDDKECFYLDLHY